jgi:putative ABC transport system ATP-binding protein
MDTKNDQSSLIVSCKGIKKTYITGTTEVPALKGVDLEVHSGELLMIVGPSGSGKTTLISIISGILTQDEGECLVFNKEINHLSEKEKCAYRGKTIGFVFQSFNLIPTLTSKENVSIPLILNGMKRIDALEQSEKLLISFGLQDKLNTYPYELSGGQQQRVAIARGCIHEPGLIVCDEPTSALDSETGVKILELLRDSVAKKNRAMVVVTHDSRILAFADRTIKLEDGHVVS